MMGNETDLRHAEKSYLVVGRVAEPDGKHSQAFVMEEGMPNMDDRQDDEVEETTTVLLSLIDFGVKEFGDD